MEWKDRKDLERRSKAELIEMLMESRRKEAGKKEKQKEVDWSKYSTHHMAFKFFYLGWDMHGLAQQPDRLNTIEEHLFRALRRSMLVPSRKDGKFGLPPEVNYQRCGRTDVGVSAFSQVVSLRLRNLKPSKEGVSATVSVSSYIHKLNSILPPEIKIYAGAEVPEDFSARYSCTERKYKYFFIQDTLDVEVRKQQRDRIALTIGQKMCTAAALLVGNHDFRNFCKIDAANVIQFVREIREAGIELVREAKNPQENLLAFVIRGSGFLWHQVRCIVAILFMIGKGEEEIDVVKQLLDVENHPCKPTYNYAPELPLVLWDCSFPSIEFNYDASVIQRVLEDLLDQWKVIETKGAMVRHFIHSLESTRQSLPAEHRVAGKRKYKALMERPVGPSLEYLIDNLSEKQKEKYNAKKQKLEEFEEKQKLGE